MSSGLRYLLDTDFCVTLIRRTSPAAEKRLTNHQVTEIAISAITVAELEFGVARSKQPTLNRERLEQFLQPLQIVAFDDAAAAAYGPERSWLETSGSMIGPLDMLIAAHALSLGLVLVTGNSREFERVHDLTMENWSV